MPYDWVTKPKRAPEKSGASFLDDHGQPPALLAPYAEGVAPIAELHAWPHRSLPRGGFVLFIGMTSACLLVPMIALIGSPVLWGILPFLMIAVGGIWVALRRNYRDGQLIEQLRIWSDRVELIRVDPNGRRRDWVANPHWVRVQIHETGGPVEHYLTLKGNGREVELGAFLSPEERQALRGDLLDTLARLR